MKKKILVNLCLGLLIILAVGCGGSESAEPIESVDAERLEDTPEYDNEVEDICFGIDTFSEEVDLNELEEFAFNFMINNIDWSKEGYDEIVNFQYVGGYYLQYKCNDSGDEIGENEICYIGMGVNAEGNIGYPVLAYCKNFKREKGGKYNIEFELIQGEGRLVQEGEDVFRDAGYSIEGVLCVDYYDQKREESTYANMYSVIWSETGISDLLNGNIEYECTNLLDVCVTDMASYIHEEIQFGIDEYKALEQHREESTFRN